ncbi:MAG: serine/threonine-protein kinase [Myxococcota bacterium]
MSGHEASPRLERGHTLDRYTIIRCVGRGAMGEVYEAHDTALDRRVAVKILLCAPGDRQLQHSIAIREGQMLARVHHPNVVAVYDVGVSDDLAYIAMEFVEGEPLAGWAKSGVTAAQFRSLAVDLARGLVAIHGAGLIHRDVKPANILVDVDGRARLADLGVAKLRSEIVPEPTPTENTWVGTPGYWAPEVEAGEAATPASDVYSLCASLSAVLPDPPPPGLGGRLGALLEAGAASDPRDRPAAQAIVDALARDRRKWAPAILGGVALLAAGTVALRPTEPTLQQRLREEATQRMEQAWSEASGPSLDAWRRAAGDKDRWHRAAIASTLQARSEQWKDAWVAAGLEPEPERALQRDCLELAIARLTGLVEIAVGFEGPSDALQAWLVQTPAPDSCRTASPFRSGIGREGDAGPGSRLRDFRRVLAADAAVYTGDNESAQEIIDELGGGEHAAVAGQVAYLRALLAFRVGGSATDAITQYRESLVLAKAAGDQLLSARAATGLSRMLGFAGQHDEAIFVVRTALAELGPEPSAELPTVWLVDARARAEAAFGSQAGKAETRALLDELQDQVQPTSYAAALLHRASALLSPAQAEEHWLAVWDIAATQLGPAHDLTLDAWEDYLRLACARFTAVVCEEEYERYLALSEQRSVNQGPAVRLYTQALALANAGHQAAAWALVAEIREAAAVADKPAEKIIAGLGLLELAEGSTAVTGSDRLAVGAAAVELVTSLGVPQYTEGALVLFAALATSAGDEDRARAALVDLKAVPLPTGDPAAARSRDLAKRYVQARIDLRWGDAAVAVRGFESLVTDDEAGVSSTWVELTQLQTQLCHATQQSGMSARAREYCTTVGLNVALPQARRELAQVFAALGTLATTR